MTAGAVGCSAWLGVAGVSQNAFLIGVLLVWSLQGLAVLIPGATVEAFARRAVLQSRLYLASSLLLAAACFAVFSGRIVLVSSAQPQMRLQQSQIWLRESQTVVNSEPAALTLGAACRAQTPKAESAPRTLFRQ